MTSLQTAIAENLGVPSEYRLCHQRQQKSAKIPLQNESSTTAAATEPLSNPALGTLIVSLPTGRLLSVQEGCTNEVQLREWIRPGDNLLRQLDGKGAQLLTLQAFGGTTRARMFARLKFGESIRPCSFVCEFAVDPTNSVNRIATIRVFGIQFATKPERNYDEFITRHNSGCSIVYFDAASVAYLGHFPSQKTGASLFSIVHADDAPLLQEVHQELRAGVKLARTNGIRFVAHDGRTWCVDSEWACFINPWNDHVEMIVAKHRFIKMVDQVVPSSVLLSEDQCRQYDNVVRLILENPPLYMLDRKNEKSDNMGSGAVSPPLTKNSEDSPTSQSPDLLLSYNQINCLENVHRLLKSQAGDSNQKTSGLTGATDANQAAPLTRELLHQHDRQWEKNCKGKWHRRLQIKRAVSSNASTTPEVAPKVARTEPTSPLAIPSSASANATHFVLGLLLEQQRRLQSHQKRLNGQLPLMAANALSNLLRQTPSASTRPNC